MAEESDIPLWGKLSVGSKLALIPAVFIAALVGILLYTVSTIEGQKLDSVVIDMAARQRTFAQKHLREVIMVSQGLDADSAASAKILTDTLEALLNGGVVIVNLYTDERATLPPPANDTIRAKLDDEKKELGEFLGKCKEFVGLPKNGAAHTTRLKELLDLSQNLDKKSNDTVKALTHNSEAKLATMIRWEIGLGAAAALLGIAFSWLITKGIVSPLGGVVGRAKKIAEGDLRGEALTMRSSDQIGQLAGVFNQMLASLKALARQTLTITQNLNAAAAQIMASIQEQAASTKQQAATVQQITTTMDEVAQSGAQISTRAKQVAAAAEATSVASSSGIQAVQDTSRTMGAIREQVEEVARNIVALSEKTQAVGEIIATVNDIAERSNLLALNAAIEAAAAGEQGSRFSVVANEMKNLADQAKDSTVQVRTILGDIQKGINSSVMFTEEAVKRVESGKQQSDATEQTIREMAKTTLESVQAFEQIIGAGNQQQIGFDQVTQGMKDIRQAVGQTAAATSQLEKAVVNLNQLSQELKQTVGRYQV